MEIPPAQVAVPDKDSPPPLEKTETITLQAEEAQEKEPASPPLSKPPEEKKIDVYRFLVQYINGKVVEKTATITPEQYRKRYPGYVTKTALAQKKSYSEGQFKKVFGKKAHSLLVQGNFGVGDVEMVMQSRTERGMPPRKNVLPAPGPESEKTLKKDGTSVA